MNPNRNQRENGHHTPLATAQLKAAFLTGAGAYLIHGGDHPGTKSTAKTAIQRRKRKDQRQARKQGRQ